MTWLRRRVRVFNLLFSVGVLVVTASVSAGSASAATSPVIVAAGDIACAPGSTPTSTTCHQQETAALIGKILPLSPPRYVAALGDLVYPAGSRTGFTNSWGPSWGKYNSIMKPVPGNHEYGTPGASGYYGYFGSRATPLERTCTSDCKGYYSYSTGSWHIVALNTRCSETTGSCEDMSAQAAWLDQDLKNHHNKCTLAYMHHPLFSGGFGATAGVKPLWDVLQSHGVDLVMAGHAHNYQRFRPQTPNGTRSPSGITEIIAGTGGASQQTLTTGTNQIAHINHAFGVVKLTLNAGGWTSEFVSTTPGAPPLDVASGSCH